MGLPNLHLCEDEFALGSLTKNYVREKPNNIAFKFSHKILCIRSKIKSINGEIVGFIVVVGVVVVMMAYALKNRF